MMNPPTLIGVAGGSGSGKTTVAKLIHKRLENDSSILYQDCYYLDLSDKFDYDGGSVNFDHPSSFDFLLMAKQLKELKNGKSIQAPQYNFLTHSRRVETDSFIPHRFIVVDGILILSQDIIRKCLDYNIYVDVTEENRFERRLLRDIRERGRSLEGARRQIIKQVRPMHDQFIEPSKKYANTIISNNGTIHELSQKIYQIIDHSIFWRPTPAEVDDCHESSKAVTHQRNDSYKQK